MEGFKNTTRMKYMCGGPVKKAMGGAVNDDPVARKVTPTAQGGPNKRQQGAPTKGQPAQPTATANPKSGGFMSGLRQTMMKAKDAYKPKVTTPRTSTRDSETDDNRRASNVVKKAMGGSVSKSMPPMRPVPPAQGVPKTKGPVKPPVKGPTKVITDPMPPIAAPTKGPPNLPKPPPLSPDRYSKGGSAKKGVPAHNSRPMIGRKAGGLAVMPKGKC